MTLFIILLIAILIYIIFIQIGRVTDLARNIRGEERTQTAANNANGFGMLIFMPLFLGACVWSALYYKDSMLGYGPHSAASVHGGVLDSIFDVTLFFTGIVFIVTHIALFWFAWKYRGKVGQKAKFFAHSSQLELIWTVIPAIVMTFLVIKGLDAWNEATADVGPTEVPGKDYIEIEAMGYQFAWQLRYPGADHKLGSRNYQLIDLANNPIGQDWNDPKNYDDFQPDKIVLPVGKKVRVRILARDVLHNFYLPHFRVKMDAVPGMPTYFVFTPTVTTKEYRNRLKNYPEYQEPADPANPEGPRRWETFEYELACAELCGKGHYSMRRIVEIVSEEEYEEWLAEQKSYFAQNIMGTDADPNKEANLKKMEAEKAAEEARKAREAAQKAAAAGATTSVGGMGTTGTTTVTTGAAGGTVTTIGTQVGGATSGGGTTVEIPEGMTEEEAKKKGLLKRIIEKGKDKVEDIKENRADRKARKAAEKAAKEAENNNN